MTKHEREVVNMIEAAGGVIERICGKKHLKIYYRIGGQKRLLVHGHTPADRRAVLNLAAIIRRQCQIGSAV